MTEKRFQFTDWEPGGVLEACEWYMHKPMSAYQREMGW